MKITIAICTYNGERTLAKALDAVLALDDFEELISEVLVIDNASKDSTKQIIAHYCEMNRKVQYVYEPVPGLSNARRRAVDAKGDWVIYVDDDNVLCPWWCTKLKEIIEQNPKLGVVNGAVIAVPTEPLTQEEEIRLELMHRNLACTHVGSIDYPAKENREPMGAGMCIITSALKKIHEQGWLELLGRTGANLASGEDTELCHRVFAMGYEYHCSYDMQMDHLIPKARLSQEYTDRLLEGLIRSRYQLISIRKHYIFERLARTVKYIMLYIAALIPAKDALSAEKKHQNMVISKAFIECVINDKLLRRRTVGDE